MNEKKGIRKKKGKQLSYQSTVLVHQQLHFHSYRLTVQLTGHFSPSCEDKFALSVQARLKVYKELRLNTELQRSISAFSGNAPI